MSEHGGKSGKVFGPWESVLVIARDSGKVLGLIRRKYNEGLIT